MKYITSEESFGTLFLYINLPFSYNDDTPDSLKSALENALPEHLWNAIEDFGFDEDAEVEHKVEVMLASNNMDTIQSLAQEMDKIVADYVEQCDQDGNSGDELFG